jgi:hypothetical protein
MRSIPGHACVCRSRRLQGHGMPQSQQRYERRRLGIKIKWPHKSCGTLSMQSNNIDLQRETEEKARQTETKLGYATQSEAEPDNPNPHTGHSVNIDLQRETEEKAHQLETKLGAIAQTRHTARLRNAKQSRTRHPKRTHGARDRPKQPRPRTGRDRSSESGTRRDVRARP